nr:NADH dehydrogenase subunit 3 [Hoplopleura edentula]
MLTVLSFAFISISLSTLIALIPLMFQSSEAQPSATMEPFECGFDPLSPHRSSYFVHFFSVGIVFILFDIETMLILPLLQSMFPWDIWTLVWTFLWVILLLGLLMEIYFGSIDWKEIS